MTVIVHCCRRNYVLLYSFMEWQRGKGLSELNEEPFDLCSSAAFAADVAAAEGSADAGAADVEAAAAADGAALVCCADTAGVITNGIANAVHNATHDARFLIKIPF